MRKSFYMKDLSELCKMSNAIWERDMVSGRMRGQF